MKNIFKRLLCTAAIIFCFGNVSAHETPENFAGYATNSDISCYINNYAIQSYIVENRCFIFAEDLARFGFDVIWDDTTRTITIERNPNVSEVTVEEVRKSGIPKTKFGDYLKTDIDVKVGEKNIKTYALENKIIIPLEELTMLGEVSWVEKERSLKLWVNGLNIPKEKQEVLDAIVEVMTIDLQYEFIPHSLLDEYRKRGWYTYDEFVCAWSNLIAKGQDYYAAAEYMYNKLTSDEFSYGFESTDLQYNTLAKYCEKIYEETGTPLLITTSEVKTDSGVPKAVIEVWNISGKQIHSCYLSFTCYDSSGNETVDSPQKYTSTIKGKLTDIGLNYMNRKTYTWTLSDHTKTTKIQNVGATKIAFSDGTVWEQK